MKLDNHIATRFLTDKSLWLEMVIQQAQDDGVDIESVIDGHKEGDLAAYKGLYETLSNENNKTFYLTKSVLEKLDLFDTKKCIDSEGWKIFKTIPDFKKTFILPDGNKCIRAFKKDNMIVFCHLEFTFLPPEKRTKNVDGTSYWILLWVDLENNKLAEHWLSEDGNKVAPFLYALMCFVELFDNEEVIVAPKAKYGTQKAGKIINSLPFPITVINNTWNIVTIRNEGFPVSGHVAMRWTGPGRSIPRLVYIQPFMKDGYVRRSGKDLSSNIPV